MDLFVAEAVLFFQLKAEEFAHRFTGRGGRRFGRPGRQAPCTAQQAGVINLAAAAGATFGRSGGLQRIGLAVAAESLIVGPFSRGDGPDVPRLTPVNSAILR